MTTPRVNLNDLRPGMTVVDSGGDEYFVLRRRWEHATEALTIDLVRAGGVSDPRRIWVPPEDVNL